MSLLDEIPEGLNEDEVKDWLRERQRPNFVSGKRLKDYCDRMRNHSGVEAVKHGK